MLAARIGHVHARRGAETRCIALSELVAAARQTAPTHTTSGTIAANEPHVRAAYGALVRDAWLMMRRGGHIDRVGDDHYPLTIDERMPRRDDGEQFERHCRAGDMHVCPMCREGETPAVQARRADEDAAIPVRRRAACARADASRGRLAVCPRCSGSGIDCSRCDEGTVSR